jgi:hypothetical protein
MLTNPYGASKLIFFIKTEKLEVFDLNSDFKNQIFWPIIFENMKILFCFVHLDV